MADVRDILDLERSITPELTRETILGSDKQKKKFTLNVPKQQKRPEGMHREVFALLYNDNKDVPPLFPTDTGKAYKSTKAKLGMRKVRPWQWMAFKNPARTDDAVFYHWRRATDEPKEYPFAKFNKQVEIPSYTDIEYNAHLRADGWTQAETDHLMDLAKRFDLRFVVMSDRWDCETFTKRSVEDLKERYYKVYGILGKCQSPKPKFIFERLLHHRFKERRKIVLKGGYVSLCDANLNIFVSLSETTFKK